MAEPSPETVFAKTDKGIEEIRSRTVKLPRDAGLVFLSIDGKASAAELLPRSGMAAPQFYRTLEMLEAERLHRTGCERLRTCHDVVGRRRRFAELAAGRCSGARTALLRLFAAASESAFGHRCRRACTRAQGAPRGAPDSRGSRADHRAKRRRSIFPLLRQHAHAGRADPRASTSSNIDADHDSSAEPPRPESIPPAYSGGATQATNRFPADRSAHEHRATGAIDTDAARSASLRIEDDGTTGEKLTVDRAVHDVLAEAVEARRSSESVLRAQGACRTRGGTRCAYGRSAPPETAVAVGHRGARPLLRLAVVRRTAGCNSCRSRTTAPKSSRRSPTHLQQPVKLGERALRVAADAASSFGRRRHRGGRRRARRAHRSAGFAFRAVRSAEAFPEHRDRKCRHRSGDAGDAAVVALRSTAHRTSAFRTCSSPICASTCRARRSRLSRVTSRSPPTARSSKPCSRTTR